MFSISCCVSYTGVMVIIPAHKPAKEYPITLIPPFVSPIILGIMAPQR